MKADPKQIFATRVSLAGAASVECEACEPQLVFALAHGEGTFSLDLTTVLRCLQVAEAEACVPRLPQTGGR